MKSAVTTCVQLADLFVQPRFVRANLLSSERLYPVMDQKSAPSILVRRTAWGSALVCAANPSPTASKQIENHRFPPHFDSARRKYVTPPSRHRSDRESSKWLLQVVLFCA